MARLSKEEALRRLRAVGIDNLVDDAIKPRQPPDATKPKEKLPVYKAATPILPLNQWDHAIIMGLAKLVEEVNDDDAKVKELLLSEVRSRQGALLNSYKYVRELRAADVAKFLRARRAQVAGSTRKRCADTAPHFQLPRPTKTARCINSPQITDAVSSDQRSKDSQGGSCGFQMPVDVNNVPVLRAGYHIGNCNKIMVDMKEVPDAESDKSLGYKEVEDREQKYGTYGESLNGRKDAQSLNHSGHDNSLMTMDQLSTPERLATVTQGGFGSLFLGRDGVEPDHGRAYGADGVVSLHRPAFSSLLSCCEVGTDLLLVQQYHSFRARLHSLAKDEGDVRVRCSVSAWPSAEKEVVGQR
ncbi:hypothetical protein JOL62DRAFT_574019 [Phyllosticta paracitricarpa]|uniref:Uncharacterized protein n=1 Tax=Phyllosticta paracitricarpa TaxID=2016321 RepID=A0ABR1N9H1_9PEZI